MTKSLFRYLLALLFLGCVLSPKHATANKFFEDNDEFFLKYLKQQKFDLDTSAAAVVLYEYNSYTLHDDLKHHVRKIIKILNRNGVDYADVVITLPGSRYGFYRVTNIHACTYNLVNGKTVKQKIDVDNISFEHTKYISEKKFSLPAVKEGSVIDYTYDVEERAAYHICKWNVQEDLPKLYTRLEVFTPREYKVAAEDKLVPAFFVINDRKASVEESTLPFAYTYSAQEADDVSMQSWVRKNVHAFESEPYISGESNYREHMEVYLNGFHELVDHGILNSWDKINRALVIDFFDKPLLQSQASIVRKAKEIAGNDTSDIKVARKIFKFVRDSVSVEDGNNLFAYKDLTKVLSDKSGTAAEVNLLLMQMLHNVGLKCSPVILATKDKETPDRRKPDLFLYNRTICQLRIMKEKYYLDASEKYYPFNMLSPECMNGYARIIDKTDSGYVVFKSDQLKEQAVYSVNTTNSSVAGYNLNCKYYFGTYEAAKYREKWVSDTEEIRHFLQEQFKGSSLPVTLKNYKIRNLNNVDSQLILDYNISITWPEGNAITYIQPYLIRFFNSNPFKSATRNYPVEFPYTQQMTYVCNLQLPSGYVIDEVPRSGIIKLDDANQNRNMIQYDKESNTLKIDSRLQMPNVYYSEERYDVLKEFFKDMIEAQQLSIVIKKA